MTTATNQDSEWVGASEAADRLDLSLADIAELVVTGTLSSDSSGRILNRTLDLYARLQTDLGPED